jgi:hypothetical protein
MSLVGYGRLTESLRLSVFPIRKAARVQPVTRIKRIGDILAVPPNVAPPPEDMLGHVLFALKHEGINLSILAQALPRISSAPNGIYIRKACYRKTGGYCLYPWR